MLAALGQSYLPDTAFADDDENEQADFTVPLLTLVKRPQELVEKLIATFLSEEEWNTTEPYRFAFWRTRNQLFENLLAASGTTLEQLERNPHKLVLPRQSGLALEELAAVYLGGTPFLPLLQVPVPFRLTARFAHHHIVATPGAGKTNLISFLVSKDLDEVAKGAASVIVLDSQGDLIHSIVRSKDFAPAGRLHDRLVYIDPTDIEHPLKLNIFARHGDRALSPLEKRTEHAQLVDLLLFLFGALRQEATGRQETLVKAVASLIQEIPDATLMTLNTIFEPAQRGRPPLEPFRDPLERLDPAIQSFFAVDFASAEFSQSRAQLRARVQSLITDPVFRAMFGATAQKLDFAAEMDAGKVILINAYEDLLKTGTEVFGRFFIALAAQAAQARQNVPEARRMPTYLYIDECYKFIREDTNVETILDTGRKYRLGVVLAHQRLNQLSDALKSAASGAAIKMARAPIYEDTRTLANQLNTTPDYFDTLPQHAFATRITGIHEPVALAIPLSPLATAEQMTDAEFAEVRSVMRRKYAHDTTAPVVSPAPPRQAETPAPSVDDANGRIDKALRLLTPPLRAFIEAELRRAHADYWQDKISVAQGSDPRQPLDAYATLKTMLDNWQTCFRHALTNKARTDVSKALEARNAISHAVGEIPAADAISYLAAIRDVALAVPAPSVVDSVKTFIDAQIKAAATNPGDAHGSAADPADAPTPKPDDPLVKPGKTW
jgi:hypothetical protein